MKDARYDVFITYQSKDPVGAWVREFFVKEFCDWLDQELTWPAHVFL